MATCLDCPRFVKVIDLFFIVECDPDPDLGIDKDELLFTLNSNTTVTVRTTINNR